MKQEAQELISLQRRKRYTNWKNEPLATSLMQDIQDAYSDYSSQMGKINSWLQEIYPKADISKRKKGRSGVSPKVIRRFIEWRCSSLTTSLLNEKKLFQIRPNSFQDAEAALNNELILNHQFNYLIPKTKFINDYIRTAVTEGTVIVRVGWETKTKLVERTKPIYDYYSPTSEQLGEIIEAMDAIGQDTQELGLESSEQSPSYKALPEGFQETIRQSSKTGTPMVAVDTMQTQTYQEEVVVTNQPTVQVVKNNRLIIDPSCDGDISKAKFMCYIYYSSYSELKSIGYPYLDDAFPQHNMSSAEPPVAGNADIISAPDPNKIYFTENEYNISHSHYGNETSFQFKDRARKRVTVYEYWGEWDIDGTGITKPIMAVIVNNTIIHMEENPFPDGKPPFVVVPYIPTPNSIYGESDAVLIKDNQDIITRITRGIIDTQARSANGQVGIPKNYLDSANLVKFRNGDDYEYNPVTGMHASEAVFVHTAPEIPQTAVALLQQNLAEAESAVGVKAFQGGLDVSAYGQPVAGMSQAVTTLNQREIDILFRLNDGLKQIGNKIIGMNELWLSPKENVAITGSEFATITRDSLPGSFTLWVDAKSNNEVEGKAQQLSFILQTLGENADWQLRKIMLMGMCSAYGMDDVTTALQQYEPQPSPQEQQQAQIELEKAQIELELLRGEIQRKFSAAALDESKATLIEAQMHNTIADTDNKSLEYLHKYDGTEHARHKDLVQAQAYAQNQGKIGQEELKQLGAIEKERVKAKSNMYITGDGQVRFRTSGTNK